MKNLHAIGIAFTSITLFSIAAIIYLTFPRSITFFMEDFESVTINNSVVQDEEMRNDLYEIISKYKMKPTLGNSIAYHPNEQKYSIGVSGEVVGHRVILLGNKNRVYNSFTNRQQYTVIDQESLMEELDNYFDEKDLYLSRHSFDKYTIDNYFKDNGFTSLNTVSSKHLGEYAITLEASYDDETFDEYFNLFLISNSDMSVETVLISTDELFTVNTSKFELEFDNEIEEYTVLFGHLDNRYENVIVDNKYSTYEAIVKGEHYFTVVKDLYDDFDIYIVDDEGNRIEE